MNLNNLLLIHSIQQGEQIPHSISQLYQIVSKKQAIPEFLLIPYIIYESNISINTYASLVNYVHSISDWYCEEKSYNTSERAWYQFYIIIRAYRSRNQDIQQIYEAFQNLPTLETNSDQLKWIGLEVKREMLFYYASLNLDPTPIIQAIDEYPEYLLTMDY